MSKGLNKKVKKASFRTLVCLFVIMILMAGFFTGTAGAQPEPGDDAETVTPRAAGTLVMSTDFPGITVKAGENVTFDLKLENTTDASVNAALSDTTPDGWDGYFEGGGSQVSSVHVSNAEDADSPKLKYIVTVPGDAADGVYDVSLLADAGGNLKYELKLSLEVSQTERSQGTFVSQFPEIQGPSTAMFGFSLSLTNNSGTDQTYSLMAQIPDGSQGWQVNFKPTGENNQIASLTIAAGKNQSLDMTVTPPANVTAGEYVIQCFAISADEVLQADLKIIISGTYTMTLSTPSGLMSVDGYADRETPVTLLITNTGSADLKDVALTSAVPENWSVRFEQSTIELLPAGASMEVSAYIKPGPNVIAGDYITIISASTNETTARADFRVAVKTSTVWGVSGVIIIVVIVLALVFVFRKFGRR